MSFWRAAWAFRNSNQTDQDRQRFLRTVPNFNLDTGFAPRVYNSDPYTMVICHDHSWAPEKMECAAE